MRRYTDNCLSPSATTAIHNKRYSFLPSSFSLQRILFQAASAISIGADRHIGRNQHQTAKNNPFILSQTAINAERFENDKQQEHHSARNKSGFPPAHIQLRIRSSQVCPNSFYHKLTISCKIPTAVSTVSTFLITMLRFPFCSRRLQLRGFLLI